MSGYKKYFSTMNIIKEGFGTLAALARVRLKKRWKSMDLEHRCAAARALVYMEQVAKNPDNYFSRSMTEKAWRERARKYAESKKMADIRGAYYIVQDPTGIVWYSAMPAFFDGNGVEYYSFSKDVQQWMYDGFSDTYAAKIAKEVKEYKKMLASESASCIARPFVEMRQAFQK